MRGRVRRGQVMDTSIWERGNLTGSESNERRRGKRDMTYSFFLKGVLTEKEGRFGWGGENERRE